MIINEAFKGKTLVITGGTGSFGNTFVPMTLAKYNPKKIIIHLIVDEDDFIETLKLIFQNRLVICKECNICKTFEMLNAVKPI